jgi:type VI secretion system secreted protein VgrG
MPRLMEIETPLGTDTLLFHGMHAREELGRVSEYQVDLLSARGDIDLDDILGKNVTIKLLTAKDQPRYFNGYVTRFAQTGKLGRYYRYVAVVRPWLWFLSRTADCRIFQNKTVPDILKAVFGDHGTAEFAVELSGSYEPWTYCVQYRETDLNFVSRLMEHEGIYSYFRHTDGHNTLVLVDSSSAHSPCPGADTVSFFAPERLVRPEVEHINRWDFGREVQPGAFVHDDYDMERPSVELKTNKSFPRGYSPSDYEIYDYPGCYVKKSEGTRYAEFRLDEYGAQFELAHASTNHRALAVGYLFTLDGFPRGDQNREHLIVSTTYDLEYSAYEGLPKSAGAGVRCTLTAMSSAQQYRPKRSTPKPFVQGPQTAVVVGPAGDEIHTDKYGRVKVQFHWDRYGKKDQQSSCWIRVSHPWAGKNWGAVAIPRIGQEVIVDFLEGDPDQPIITGRVYNAEQMPPYGLPANMTQTGIKSRSTLNGNPDNFNEIRFEDKKGSEQLFIHAEKNQDIEVENDETHWVGHDRAKTIDHDETTHVKHDRTETVDNNESITIGVNRTESVGKNETISIGKDRTESVAENETVDVGKDQSLSVGANRTRSVGKDESVSIGEIRKHEVGKDEEISIGKNRKVSVGENDALQVGKKLAIQAGEEISIQTGSASITMKKDGTITIKGKDITLNGSGKINVKASSDVVVKGSKVTQN